MNECSKESNAVSYDVFGLWCSSCSLSLEKKLASTPGIESASISFSTAQATVRFKAGFDLTTLDLAAKSVARSLGYSLLPPLTSVEASEYIDIQKQYLVRLAVVLFSSMWSMAFSIAYYSGEGHLFLLLSALTAFPGIAYGLIPFIRAASVSLRSRIVTFDVLVSAANLSLFLLSSYNLLFSKPGVYFESIAMTLAVILTARYLESRFRFQARSTLVESLVNGNISVNVYVGDEWRSAEPRSVRAGRLVRFLPNSEVCFDSEIVDGSGLFDVSVLTGESRPVYFGKGASVLAGSRFLESDRSSFLSVKVIEPIGNRWIDRQAFASFGRSSDETDSLFHKIIQIWAPLTLVVGLVGGILRAALSTGSFFVTAVATFASILLVTCPCSLVLAEPLSMLWLVRKGKFKFSPPLEFQRPIRFSKIVNQFKKKVVFFDKTGTLVAPENSKGQQDTFTILDEGTRGVSPLSRDEVRSLAAECVIPFPHPTTQFLVRDQMPRGAVQSSNHFEHPGKGVEMVQPTGRRVRVGSVAWIVSTHSNGHSISSQIASDLLSRFKNLVEIDDQIVAGFGRPSEFSLESLSSDLIGAVRRLRQNGYEVGVLSGDRASGSESSGRMSELFSILKTELSPSDKESIVADYKRRGYFVAFVGDGINDLAALKSSDLAIAVRGRQQVTQNAGHCVIDQSQVNFVGEILAIINSTYKRQQIGLLAGLSYNFIMVPIAITGLLHPLVAAASMAVSSIVISFLILRKGE